MRLGLLFITGAFATLCLNAQWPFAGRDLHNTRSGGIEPRITTAAASNLNLKWSFTPGGDVSATPALSSNAVYVPDWERKLLRLNATNGLVGCSKMIGD